MPCSTLLGEAERLRIAGVAYLSELDPERAARVLGLA